MITGAATGIGALPACSLAAASHIVYATMRAPHGRNADRAAALRAGAAGSPGALYTIDLDVLAEESAAQAVARIVEEQGRVDVVVHNAAHLFVGITETFTTEQVIKAYDVNCVGAFRVTRAVLPSMRRQGAGLLVWNGSGTTRAIPPFLAPYTIAKAAFDALAESFAWDVASCGIETTIIHPGVFTEGTAHFANAEFAADTDRTADYNGTPAQRHFASSGEDTHRLFPSGISADPQVVADEITRIIGLEPGTRPRRSVADGSDYGAEIINGAAEELRRRLARRMHIGALLGNEAKTASPPVETV